MALNLLGIAFVVRSGRKRGNRQTDGRDKRNDRQSTATLTAHAPRVNNYTNAKHCEQVGVNLGVQAASPVSSKKSHYRC